MVQPTDMLGPTAQFIANSNPAQGVNRAVQGAGMFANQMEIAPGIAKILGGLGQGPSPVGNASPMNAAMSALNAGQPGGMRPQGAGGLPYEQPMMNQVPGMRGAPGGGQMQPPSGRTPMFSQLAGGAGMGGTQGMFQQQQKPYGYMLGLAGMGRRGT